MAPKIPIIGMLIKQLSGLFTRWEDLDNALNASSPLRSEVRWDFRTDPFQPVQLSAAQRSHVPTELNSYFFAGATTGAAAATGLANFAESIATFGCTSCKLYMDCPSVHVRRH